MPNSQGGWWIYKNYSPEVPDNVREWANRGALLQSFFFRCKADIICIQEAHGESFESDFSYMKRAGYDYCLHRKFRLRNATFWRRDRWEEEVSYHKDKVLVTTLKSTQKGTASAAQRLHIVNCHLTGGPLEKRRLRQVFEGLDQVRKITNRLKADHATARVVVCGDFNTEAGPSAPRELLVNSEVSPEYRSPNTEEESLTSKTKSHPFGAFEDVHTKAYGEGQWPATLIGKQLRPLFTDEKTGRSTAPFREKMKEMFALFSNKDGAMDREGIERWILKINRGQLRGSEYRKVSAILEEHTQEAQERGQETESGPAQISLKEFISLYVSELKEGKYWAVHHDMATCGVALLPSRKPYTSSIDHLYYTTQTLEVVAVREGLSAEERDRVLYGGETLPNTWHPSDHLPVTAVLRWK